MKPTQAHGSLAIFPLLWLVVIGRYWNKYHILIEGITANQVGGSYLAVITDNQ